MPKCPNCAQRTTRTEDWACQWCGYPLLSGSFKKTPKTYKQLKEERLYKQPTLVSEETEVFPEPNHETLPPTQRLEPEPDLAPETMIISEVEAEPEPVAEAEIESLPEAKAETIIETRIEPVTAEMEITVEELLSAYETYGEAADARFINKILKLTGVVGRIEIKENLDIYYITLTSAEKERLQTVRCMFDKTRGAELNRLAPRQTVTVKGTYDGSIIDIRMRDCVLVH